MANSDRRLEWQAYLKDRAVRDALTIGKFQSARPTGSINAEDSASTLLHLMQIAAPCVQISSPHSGRGMNFRSEYCAQHFQCL